jgi:hypothetical protein
MWIVTDPNDALKRRSSGPRTGAGNRSLPVNGMVVESDVDHGAGMSSQPEQ